MKHLLPPFLVAVLALNSGAAASAAVPVGGSALIDDLHYSDTFTLTEHGGILGRIDGVYPVGAPGIDVEDNHGNAPQAWSDWRWSFNVDLSAFPTTNTPYPGGNGAGSETGMTQTGVFGGGADFGIEYGLSSHYVVQYDAVLTGDRIDISSSSARDTIFAEQGSLAVFFRGDNRAEDVGVFPNIGLYNPAVGEADSGLAARGIGVNVGEWANFAVRFDQVSHEIEVYVNETSLGVLDLSTFAGGAYDNWSNAAVNIGGNGYGHTDVVWTDNFQVGAPATTLGPMPDLNMDGKVDIFDVAIVSNNWANVGTPGTVAGDANKDGVVDIFDVALISNHWNPGGGATAVPEPGAAALALVALGGACLTARRRRR